MFIYNGVENSRCLPLLVVFVVSGAMHLYCGAMPRYSGATPPQGAPPVMHNKKELQEDWLGPPGVSHARPITGHRLEAGSCSICDPDTSIAYGPTRL